MMGSNNILLWIAGFLGCILTAQAAVYSDTATVDIASVNWMRASQAATRFKVITPDPTGYPGAFSFFKVRAFLSRNINLTIEIHGSSPDDTIEAFAIEDSNQPGDQGKEIWTLSTWDYVGQQNYTLTAGTMVETIPLWTGEAFYMRSTGDLSGTVVTQDYEEEKTLLEAVVGADLIGIRPRGQGPSVVTGYGVDSVPAMPSMWGSDFVFPAIPKVMFTDGYQIKCVTWNPYQVMRLSFIGTRKDEEFTYDGHGAAVYDILVNEPVRMETGGIAYCTQLLYSDENNAPGFMQIPDVRTGTDWYQVNGMSFADSGAELFVSVVIKTSIRPYLSMEVPQLGIGRTYFVADDNETVIHDYTCSVGSIPQNAQTTIATDNIEPFVMMVFARCSGGSCGSCNSAGSNQNTFIDASLYSGPVPTPAAYPPPTTPSPTTPSPTTPSPITPSPTTPNPVTPNPTTPSPITPSPNTPNPTTPGPTTPVPTSVETLRPTPGPTSTATPDIPKPYPNPFDCPCVNAGDFGQHTSYLGTYLRKVHPDGLDKKMLHEMMAGMNPMVLDRFGVQDSLVTFNERFVWSHHSCDEYLFYHSKEVKYWLFGPEIGASTGPAVNYGSGDIPVNALLGAPWRLEDNNDWIDSPDAYTECDCADVKYEALYFDTTDPQEYEGFYYIYGILNDHMVYKHMNSSYYLYYYQENADANGQAPMKPTGCEYWAISASPGGKAPLAYIKDAVHDVAQIGEGGLADWLLFGGDHAAPDPFFTDLGALLTPIDMRTI